MPDVPATSASQKLVTSWPSGVIAPMPVITTRRRPFGAASIGYPFDALSGSGLIEPARAAMGLQILPGVSPRDFGAFGTHRADASAPGPHASHLDWWVGHNTQHPGAGFGHDVQRPGDEHAVARSRFIQRVV